MFHSTVCSLDFDDTSSVRYQNHVRMDLMSSPSDDSDNKNSSKDDSAGKLIFLAVESNKIHTLFRFFFFFKR